MRNMRLALFLALASVLFAMGGCTEVEYVSHVVKTHGTPAQPSSPVAEGNFKIGNPYKIDGRWYYPREQYDLTETGIASWYGPGFDGKKTANGEIFDSSELTAAHRTLQMPSLVRVTNLDNGRSLIVRVNDRGPYKRGRIIDLSAKAAELLDFKGPGTAKVKLQVLREESLKIAQAARSGVNVKGYEVAYNQGVPGVPQATPPGYQTAAYGQGTLTTPSEAQPALNEAIPGHNRNGQFYPDPVVTEFPVIPSQIYIQAGSFTVYDNAVRLRDTLRDLGSAEIFQSDIQGRSFYRVRLGPVSNVAEADEILARVAQAGHSNALIVVE